MMLAALSLSLLMNTTHAALGVLEHVGKPVRALNIVEFKVAADRQSGRELLVFSNNNEAAGMDLIFVDPETNVARTVKAPAGAGAEGLAEVAGDRLVLGTFYDGTVMVFDLRQMRFVRSIPILNEQYIWGFAIGNDGRAYGGTYPGGKLIALDLDTYDVEVVGVPAPPNKYVRNVVATSDGRILCRLLVDDPRWLIYDPATRTFASMPEETRSVRFMAVWKSYIVAGSRVYDRDLRSVPPPFDLSKSRRRIVQPGDSSEAAASVKWEVDPFLTTRDVLYIWQGRSLWRFDQEGARGTLISSIDLRGGRFLATLKDGRLAGIRGQDYFIFKPGDRELDLKRIPEQAEPRNLLFLRADPDGCLWMGPPYGQTLAWMDPRSGQIMNTPAIADVGGEVYDVAFVDGSTYAVAYFGGDVVRYDRTKPWDQWGQSNPTTVASVANAGYRRPMGGVIAGPGRKLYSGWASDFGTYGGAVAITDPVSGATDLARNPLGEQQVLGLATDGQFIYLGSGTSGSGLDPRPGQSAKFGILDPATRRVIKEWEFSGSERVRVLGYDPLTKIVVVIVDLRIQLFDVTARAFLAVPDDFPPVHSWITSTPGDGRFYFGSFRTIRALDLRSLTVTTLAEAPGPVNNVTCTPDGTVYAGVGADLYAVRVR
jgi:WD40 repeat protein